MHCFIEIIVTFTARQTALRCNRLTAVRYIRYSTTPTDPYRCISATSVTFPRLPSRLTTVLPPYSGVCRASTHFVLLYKRKPKAYISCCRNIPGCADTEQLSPRFITEKCQTRFTALFAAVAPVTDMFSCREG